MEAARRDEGIANEPQTCRGNTNDNIIGRRKQKNVFLLSRKRLQDHCMDYGVGMAQKNSHLMPPTALLTPLAILAFKAQCKPSVGS